MATPVQFESLLDIDGVKGAVRWREAVPGKGALFLLRRWLSL